MHRHLVRAIKLLLVVALVVVGAGSLSTAHAASVSGAGTAEAQGAMLSHVAAVSGSPCTFTPTTSCTSTDPTVTVDTYYTGSTTGCIFAWDIVWGDGNSSDGIVISQPSDGYVFTGQHTYAKPGLYTIALFGEEDGPCSITGGHFTFVLANSPLSAPYNLTATAVDPHDIRLNWQYGAGNNTGFEINNGVTSQFTGSASRTYTWNGLAPGTYMCFKIRAYNATNDSAWYPDSSPWYVCATTPRSSPVPTPKPKSCPTVLLGVHGFREGPDSTKPSGNKKPPEISPTLQSTWKYFRLSQPARAHGSADYIIQNVSYPTTGWWELDNPLKMRTIVSDVVDGSHALEKQIQHFTSLCRGSTFELVGFSEGAWIIDYWLHFNQDEADQHVKAIQLYGDPNWYKAYDHSLFGLVVAYQGLSRIANLTFGWYGPPYPKPHTPYAMQSVCLPMDPVCGRGYDDSQPGHTAQFAAAVLCSKLDHCAHFDYPSGSTEQGAEFLAKHAF